MFAYGKWVKGMEFVELFQAVVGIAVSMIPEGLPALITDNVGNWRAANGSAPRDHTETARRGNTRLGVAYLLRQDGHPDANGDDGRLRGHRGVDVPDNRNGYAPEGKIKKGREPVKKDTVLGLMGQVSTLCNDAELFNRRGRGK